MERQYLTQRGWYRRLLPWLLTAMAVIPFLLIPASAEAHAFLVSTTPQPGERLGGSPASIQLRFSEPVVGGEQLTISTANGEPVDAGPPEHLQGGIVVQSVLPPLPDGAYVASWRVLADDGHVSLGEFAFAVGNAGEIPAQTNQSSAPLPWQNVAAGWMFMGGLLLAFGGLGSERSIWRQTAQRHSLTVPMVPIAWLLVLAIAGSLLQTSMLLQQTLGFEGGGVSWWADVIGNRPLALSIVQLLLLVDSIALLAVRRARYWLLAPLGLALVVAAVSGHSGTTEHWWAAPANTVHLLAVAFWVGALVHLLLVSWQLRSADMRPALAQGARRYSRVALGLVLLVLASGTISALAQFTDLGQVWDTRYGQVLLFKLALVVLVLGVALAARRFALPANPGFRSELLRRLVTTEGTLLIVVTVAAVVLANAAPPRSASASEDLLGPPPLEGPVLRLGRQAGWFAIYLAAAENQLRVEALPPGGEPDPETDVRIEGRAPDGSTFDISPRTCGPTCVTTAFPWQPGTTTFDVQVSGEQWEGGSAEFEVSWPLQPENQELLSEMITTMREQPRITMTERVTSGPGASSEHTFSLTGEQFMSPEMELYVSGGASHVHPIPAGGSSRVLTPYLSGSRIWYRLEIDTEDRLQRETILSPGHLIERTFRYDESAALPQVRAERVSQYGWESRDGV